MVVAIESLQKYDTITYYNYDIIDFDLNNDRIQKSLENDVKSLRRLNIDDFQKSFQNNIDVIVYVGEEPYYSERMKINSNDIKKALLDEKLRQIQKDFE